MYYFLCGISILIVFYLFLIMPNMSHRLDSPLWKEHFYAHRGIHQNHNMVPENSIAAFKLAIESGYGIELDVQITKDKIPVVIHDYSLKRVCRVDKKVNELTFQELRQFTLYDSKEHIPSFESVLNLVKGRVPLIIELKVEGKSIDSCEYTDLLLKQYRGIYCIESFNPLVLLWYKKHKPEIIRGQLSSHFLQARKKNGRFLYFLLQNLLLNFLTKPDFIAYNHKHSYMPSYILCHRLFKIATFAWTIQSQEDLDKNYDKFDYFIFDSFTPKK